MPKKRLEKSAEGAVNRHAKKLKILRRKMNGFGFNSWPDQLYLGTKKRFVWIEFKRVGKEPTPLQAEMHKTLRFLGHKVLVITDDNIGEAHAALEAIVS